MMNFGQSIAVCFSKYVDFKGRASRSEYWWFALFYVIVTIVAGKISVNLDALVSLILLLPSIAVATRRLHDTNRSGWWQLIAITIVGMIPLIIWLASKTIEEDNKYGEYATAV